MKALRFVKILSLCVVSFAVVACAQPNNPSKTPASSDKTLTAIKDIPSGTWKYETLQTDAEGNTTKMAFTLTATGATTAEMTVVFDFADQVKNMKASGFTDAQKWSLMIASLSSAEAQAMFPSKPTFSNTEGVYTATSVFTATDDNFKTSTVVLKADGKTLVITGKDSVQTYIKQ